MDRYIIIQRIDNALNDLYVNNEFLFVNDLCERCINYKFAVSLEKQNFGANYFIDCEYNRAYSKGNGGIGSKKVTSKEGNFIDIVITKRNDNPDDDLICIETKKWNNSEGNKGFNDDRQKLKILTGNSLPIDTKSNETIKDENGDYYIFNYKYGFFIIFGRTRDGVMIELFKK